jgi:hypothetical protein
LLDVL